MRQCSPHLAHLTFSEPRTIKPEELHPNPKGQLILAHHQHPQPFPKVVPAHRGTAPFSCLTPIELLGTKILRGRKLITSGMKRFLPLYLSPSHSSIAPLIATRG